MNTLAIPDSICRTCTQNSKEVIEIDNLAKIVNKIVTISSMILAVGNVKVEVGDNLPQQICINCLKDLRKAYLFRNKCMESDAWHKNRQDPETKLKESKKNEVEYEIIDSLEFNTQDLSLKEETNEDNDSELFEFFEELCEQNDSLISEIDILKNENRESNTLKTKEDLSVESAKLENPNIPNFNETEKEKPKEKQSENKLYKCKECSKVLRRKRSYELHLQIHNKNSSYLCNFCGKKFNAYYRYYAHLIRHRSSHKCTFCEKVFTCNAHLKMHLRIHTGEKPFTCHICGLAVSQKSTLATHMKVHTGERPFQCDYCDKTFRESRMRLDHMRVHTGEKPFACKKCEKTFHSKKNLRSHLLIHEGNKPFVCSICLKCYTRKSNLNYHMKTHSGEKLHVCHICDMTFIQKICLINHLAKHRNE